MAVSRSAVSMGLMSAAWLPTLTSPSNSRGGKTSKASQLVRTRRPMRLWSVSMANWHSAPPVSLPTSVTSVRSSMARNAVDDCRDAARTQVGVGVHRDRMRAGWPGGRVAADAAFGEYVGNRRPELVIDQQAVHEHDRWECAVGRAGDAVSDSALHEFDAVEIRNGRWCRHRRLLLMGVGDGESSNMHYVGITLWRPGNRPPGRPPPDHAGSAGAPDHRC